MKRAALAGIVAALWLAPATPALAHAVLESSQPAADERVERLDEIRLRFTEHADPSLSAISIQDAAGNVVALGALRADGVELSAPVTGEPEPGTYLVTWRAFSRVDGHVTAGAFAIGFQAEPSAIDVPEPEAPGVSALSTIGRTLFLLGVALAFGAGVVELLSPLAVRALPWLAFAGAVTALAGVAAFGHVQRVDSGVAASTFLGTSIGRAVLWRAAALLVAGGLAVAWRRWMRRRAPLVAGMLVAIGVAGFVHVANGHAAARGGVQVALQLAHLIAVSAWVGGLVPLLVAERRGNARRVVTRFSTMALVAVVVVVATGQLRSFDELGTFLAATEGTYGRVVTAKVVVLGGILALALRNRRRNVALVAEDPGPLRRAVRGEVALATIVLALTGLLANLTPRPEAAVAAELPSATRTNFAGDLQATLVADPGTPGANRFAVTLTTLPGGAPVEDAAVSLRFRNRIAIDAPTTTLELTEAAPGVYEGQGANLSPAGPFEITILVQQASGSDQILVPLATRTDQQSTELGGDPAITKVTFADGSSVQSYLDPSAPGAAEFHATWFDADGSESSDLGEIRIVASGPDGVRPLVARRLTPGHVVADVFLSPGVWRFDVVATTEQGEQTAAWFEREVI